MKFILLTVLAFHTAASFAETCESTFYHAAVVGYAYASGVRVPPANTPAAFSMIERVADDLDATADAAVRAALAARPLPEQIKWLFEQLHVASEITAGAFKNKMIPVLEEQVRSAPEAARVFKVVFRRIIARPNRDLLPYFEELRVLAYLTNSTPAGYSFALPVQMKILTMSEELPELSEFAPMIENGILQILSWQGKDLTDTQGLLFEKILGRHLAGEPAPAKRLLMVSSYLLQLIDTKPAFANKPTQKLFRFLLAQLPDTLDVTAIPPDLVTPYADLFQRLLTTCRAHPRLTSADWPIRLAAYVAAFTYSPGPCNHN